MIIYKRVNSAPLEPISELYREAGWVDDHQIPKLLERLPKIISQSFCFIVAITDKNNYIGMGRVISDGISDAYIQDVIVKREFRGQGIGKNIVKKLTEYCIEQNLGWIGIVAEPNTAKFYEQLDFKQLANYQPMLYTWK
jgi:ribosomal protein S18 acetylase RimI-like enzyme